LGVNCCRSSGLDPLVSVTCTDLDIERVYHVDERPGAGTRKRRIPKFVSLSATSTTESKTIAVASIRTCERDCSDISRVVAGENVVTNTP